MKSRQIIVISLIIITISHIVPSIVSWSVGSISSIRLNNPITQNLTQEDVLPPEINIISPRNQTYPATVWYCALDAFNLEFTINEPVVWIKYTLDGEENITIEGNVTVDTTVGYHHVTVYANDTSGNIGASETVFFTIKSYPPSSSTTLDETNSSTVTTTFRPQFPMFLAFISLFILLRAKKRNLKKIISVE